MAANRFATLIHRKTNRITLLLVYAFLEWSLIFFILLNSLFSYFILRFADYFGLKRPCLFCSRLDRFFHASGDSPSHRDLLCDDHALEISSKPLESKGFGESRWSSSDEFTKDLIDLSVEKKTDSSCFPDLGDIGYSFNTNLIGDDVQIHNGRLFTELSRSIFVLEEEQIQSSIHLNDSQEPREEETENNKLPSENDFIEEEERKVTECFPQSPAILEEEEEVTSDDDDDDDDDEFSCYISSLVCNKEVTIEKEEVNNIDLATEDETAQATDKAPVESAPPQNLEFIIDEQDCHFIPVKLYKSSEEVREISDVNGDFILDFGAEPDFAAEEISTFASPEDQSKQDDAETNIAGSSTDDSEQMQNGEEEEETDAEVSIGTEIPDHEQIRDIPSQQQHSPHHDDDHIDHEEVTLEFPRTTTETKKPILETPGSMESLHCHLDQRGCVEGGVLTVDMLVLELEEERKALNALYVELEEERSASAIAANETMAMINRLHEEKAAMQMEALQYQRMMEEQSEFDQEALQLLNELVVKREKDNAELEKELEVCRKRLEEYEAKEMVRRRMRDSSVDSFRTNGDADESNGELLLQHKSVERGESTPVVDVVGCLDECLDDYEGERLSILGRLKFLEEKLSTLSNEVEVGINGNGHCHEKETSVKQRTLKSKRLLPLFDAVDGEMGNGYDDNGIDEGENGEIVTVEEEVDELYERLEALEADREFLRHCVGSLKKGDKGVHLLSEILQHLRDLKNIDLIHVRGNEEVGS